MTKFAVGYVVYDGSSITKNTVFRELLSDTR